MTKRSRSEEEDEAWEETKEPWIFWGLEQERWIDAIVAYCRETPMTVVKFYFQISIWPHVTIPPTIGPECAFSLDEHPSRPRLLFRVKLSIHLWKQLRSGCWAFLREVMRGVADKLPDFEFLACTNADHFIEKTSADYAKCCTDVHKRAV